MTQCSFGREQAHEAIDQFLAGDTMARTIYTETGEDGYGHGEPLAEILSPDHYNDLRNKAYAFTDQVEKADRPGHERGAYEPYIVAPGATVERVLPTDHLHPILAHAMYGKDFNDLDEKQRAQVTGVAIMAVIHVQLDADSRGMVPVLRWEVNGDDRQLTWQLARKTNTPGLYVRESHGLFGEVHLVTGSGWLLPQTFYDTDHAERFAKELADEVPGIDWFAADQTHMTADVVARIHALYRRVGPFASSDVVVAP